MRCSCRQCGEYMVQEEYGLKSGCRCPSCGAMCRDCMGSVQQPMTPEEIKNMFALGLFQEARETDTSDARESESKYENEYQSGQNWRKNL